MVAVKFLSDVFYTNAHIARTLINVGVGGLPVEELNRLELEFLLYNDFNLTLSTQEIEQCLHHMNHYEESPLLFHS